MKPPYRISDNSLFAYLSAFRKEDLPKDNDDFQLLTNVLWERLHPLSKKVVKSYGVRPDRKPDFTAFAEDTLRDCIERYEPQAAFHTYYTKTLLPRAASFLRTMDSSVRVPNASLEYSGRRKATDRAIQTEKDRIAYGRAAALPAKSIYNEDNSLAVDVADDAPSPEDILIAKDLEDKTAKAMKKLTKLDREIVRRKSEGESFVEIGKSLYLTERQTSARYKAAISSLRRALGE